MDKHFYAHQIRRAAKVCDVKGEPWLLIADFAEIEGRIECVGIEVRSYLRHQETVVLGESDMGGEHAELTRTYDAYWTGAEVNKRWVPSRFEINDQLVLWEVDWHDLALHDPEAIQAQAQQHDELLEPRPLHVDDLRALGIGSQLDYLRRALAAHTGRLSDELAALHLAVAREDGNVAARAELEGWPRRTALTREAICAGPKRPGRPRKYDRALRARVADSYRKHFPESRAPTKDVAKELGLALNVASKLVMQCRKDGLIEPARRSRWQRKPGPDAPPRPDDHEEGSQ